MFADEYREITGSGIALQSALAETATGTLVSGNVLVTYVMTKGTDEQGATFSTPLGGDAFVRALMPRAPDILLRNVASESTVGAINTGTDTKPFFALRVDSYERTYAGMLTWEPLMARDLAVIYPLHPAEALPAITPAATSTATTSVPVALDPMPAAPLSRFSDAIVANHDVRVLRDTMGRSLILYGYADKLTLLIARDEAAFEALLARLKAE